MKSADQVFRMNTFVTPHIIPTSSSYSLHILNMAGEFPLSYLNTFISLITRFNNYFFVVYKFFTVIYFAMSCKILLAYFIVGPSKVRKEDALVMI